MDDETDHAFARALDMCRFSDWLHREQEDYDACDEINESIEALQKQKNIAEKLCPDFKNEAEVAAPAAVRARQSRVALLVPRRL